MDARITKQRLANMLSYDWLKILGAIALAATVFCVFFMMIATRTTAGQNFFVYAYNGVSDGGDFSRLGDDLKDRNVFAYDILSTGSETFSKGGLYGSSVYMARRSSGEGRAMFVDDERTKDEKTEKVSSTLLSFIDEEGTKDENFSAFLNPEEFLKDCETYLKNFFGEDLSEELNTENARASFIARNGKDKRFRTKAKKEAGVKQEIERLNKLKEDFLAVKEAVDTKLLDFVRYEGFEGKVHTLGFSMGKINKITSLVYYVGQDEEGKKIQKQDNLVLCLFDNGTREGDLKYETVNFLAYLLRTYQK